MTDAPDPLTLVELVRYLGERGYWLGYDSSGMYIAMPVEENSPAACGTGSTPWEAANEALPERQVDPRDEAAELRAENERLRADLFEYVLDAFVQGAHRQEDGGYHTGGISTYRDLGNWLVEHAHWTRRPGGRGRNQVYDPPKADAASEGQPLKEGNMQDLSNAKVIAWEDENGGAYLWGTHDMGAQGVAEAIETHVIETQVVFDEEMFKSFSEAVAGGEALWAHPACLDITDAPWPREFVSKEPRPGWVRFLRGEMP